MKISRLAQSEPVLATTSAKAPVQKGRRSSPLKIHLALATACTLLLLIFFAFLALAMQPDTVQALASEEPAPGREAALKKSRNDLAFSTSDAVEVPVDMRLTGVLSKRQNPLAVINAGGRQSIYAVGDRLSNGLELIEIASDCVTFASAKQETALCFNGRRTLPMPEERALAEVSTKPGAASTAITASVASSPSAASVASVASVAAAASVVLARSEQIHPHQNQDRNLVPAVPTNASWTIPVWLQNGMSGPPSPDALKSPWSRKKT
ncbi:hypothetical protein BH11PSE11_BH11PSE11_14080 [soil metagenome]